ncbi:hypothetical protein ACJ41O_003489 [Fusarium nematophilum]
MLIVSATICSVLILTRIAYRLLFRCKQHPTCHRRWREDDTYMAFALLPLLARTVLMAWSSALSPDHSHDPATAGEAAARGMSVEQLDADKELALMLLIPIRILYALFLWILKLCLLNFYSRFIGHLGWGRIAIITLWWAVIITFFCVVIATVTECRPLHLTWEVGPADQLDPCSRGIANLLVMAIFNAVTDVALLILPFPILNNTQLDRRHKLQLALLFGIGIITVAITIVRIPLIFMASVNQSIRSQWASVEVICACVVANAAFFYALFKDFQGGGHGHSSNNNRRASDFYLQDFQSTPSHSTKRKSGQAVAFHVEESRPPSGTKSEYGLV